MPSAPYLDLKQKEGAGRNSLPCESFLDAPSGETGVARRRSTLNQMLPLKMNDYILTFSIILDREQSKIVKPAPQVPLLNLFLSPSSAILKCFLTTELCRK